MKTHLNTMNLHQMFANVRAKIYKYRRQGDKFILLFTLRDLTMNWEQYRNILSSAATFPASSSGTILSQRLPQRHPYLSELKGSSPASMLYQRAYLPYLTPRAKEFQPTVVTRPSELNLKEEALPSPSSSSPRTCTSDGKSKTVNYKYIVVF